MRYCGRTAATALDFLKHVVVLKVFESVVVLDFDSHLVGINKLRQASLEVLIS